MDKNNDLRVHPVNKMNNNIRRDSAEYSARRYNNLQYGDDIYYRDVLLERLAREAIKVEMYKAKVLDLEKRLEASQKRKIVSAPLKDVKPVPKELRQMPKVDVKTLNTNARTKNAISAYSNMQRNAPKPQIKIQQQPKTQPQLPIAVFKEPKPSIWQKIKKSVKSFFFGEEKTTQTKAQPQTWNQQNNNPNNTKYNQFRQNMPKATVNIDVKNNTKPQFKDKNHILDRYV